MKIKEHLALVKRGIGFMYELEKTFVIMTVLSSVFSALIPFVPIYMSARIVDELVQGRRISYLVLYAALTVGLAFGLHLLNVIFSKIRNYHMDAVMRSQSRAFAEKTMALDYDQIENHEIHLLREKIEMESRTGYNMFYLFTSFQTGVRELTSVVASMAITTSLFIGNQISVLAKLGFLAAVAAICVVNFIANVRDKKIDMDMMDECVPLNSMGGYLFDYFMSYQSGMEVRMYGMEALAAEKIKKYHDTADETIFRAKKKQLPITFLEDLMLHTLQFVTYLVVILAVVSGELSVGSIAKYVSTVCAFVWAIQELIRSGQTMCINNHYLKTYFSFFDLPSHMYQGTLPVEKRAFCEQRDTDYEIEFRNVSFRYPGSETFALKNVSLKFRVGQRLAVVGMNGSGKTTFIKLLCRLYDPTEGEILLNGIDIRKYDYEEYLSIFSVVFQDFKLFSFSIGQNVAASVDYDQARVEKCLTGAGFGGKLRELPAGMETCLYKDFDQNGVEISGGEAQKIALARAVYKDAPFIVLDEPTAALDPIAEAEIYERFNEIVGDKTAIYISHRLSSCKFCDEILVFDGGTVSQRGSHEALLKNKAGKYYELWNAQAQYYVGNEG